MSTKTDDSHARETDPASTETDVDIERDFENWGEKHGDKSPYAGDDEEKRRPDEVPPDEYERDEEAGYNPAAGAQSREAALRAGRCAEPLDRWEERYGEPRYCTRLPEAVFFDGGSERCQRHKENQSSST